MHRVRRREGNDHLALRVRAQRPSARPSSCTCSPRCWPRCCRWRPRSRSASRRSEFQSLDAGRAVTSVLAPRSHRRWAGCAARWCTCRRCPRRWSARLRRPRLRVVDATVVVTVAPRSPRRRAKGEQPSSSSVSVAAVNVNDFGRDDTGSVAVSGMTTWRSVSVTVSYRIRVVLAPNTCDVVAVAPSSPLGRQ